MMWDSVSKIAALSGRHEDLLRARVSLNNARFAVTVEPENEALKLRAAEVGALRTAGKPTLPTTH